MKFLYFHQHFSTPQGSSGTRSYEMARRLIARGHHVVMVCGSAAGGNTGLSGPFEKGRRRGMVDGIEVLELALTYSNRDNFLRRTLTFLGFAWRSLLVALREDCDVVFATTTPLTAGIPGIAARWLRNKPFVFEVRDLWPELPKAMGVITNPLVLFMMSVLEWVSYRSATRLVALSPGIAHGIAARGVSEQKIQVIPNGCDLDIFAAAPVPWRPVEVPEANLMAIFTGTHGMANGLHAVLDAAAELKRRGRDDISLVLIGDGMKKPELVARARSEALDNMVFLAPVSKIRLAGLMASADLGLQTLANVPAFYYGTSPNKFFDYIAAGRPVLNNYPGWLAELISSHNCGFAVPPENPQAFADALMEAADDRKALREMGGRAQALAHAEFSRDLLASRFVGWLEGSIKI